jgi:hypothetical protein
MTTRYLTISIVLITGGLIITYTHAPSIAGNGEIPRDNSMDPVWDNYGTTTPSENNSAPQPIALQWVAEHVSFAAEREGFEPSIGI